MNAPDAGPLDPRVAELLSAALDGAVTPEEQEVAEAWVQRSPAARAERDGLAAVKAALGGLPAVEPPAGFFETLLAQGLPPSSRDDTVVVPLRRRRPALPVAIASAVAAAAACVVVAGTSFDTVTPPVGEVEAALSRPAADVDVVRVDGARVALLRQDGEVAWEELPDGERDDREGASTWVDLTSDPEVARVVVARDGRVYTLVSEDLGAEELLDVGVELPGDDGLLGRFRRACDSLLDAFSGG